VRIISLKSALSSTAMVKPSRRSVSGKPRAAATVNLSRSRNQSAAVS
jgi:hypothetical protein